MPQAEYCEEISKVPAEKAKTGKGSCSSGCAVEFSDENDEEG